MNGEPKRFAPCFRDRPDVTLKGKGYLAAIRAERRSPEDGDLRKSRKRYAKENEQSQ
jgi:hypothetical protein